MIRHVAFHECTLPPDAFDPQLPIGQIILAAARTAPPLVGDTLVVTSVYREGDPGYHGSLEAVDIRVGLFGPTGPDAALSSYSYVLDTGSVAIEMETGRFAPATNREIAYAKALRWASRLSDALGPAFDLVYGTKPVHVNHIHVERDRAKWVARLRGEQP